ncbi:COG1361 family protein [Myroides pelagicus]|uniref:PEGA domain-containing protein n=1 Tax=Myroides pelagicus TaxID=270914 RepID=A0A7K1GPS2_9FLAO|nr:hypothetical protein [Myroides pelagicus]MEC4115040.1 hypothetical protein [Myroides pelagicus]MTH30730.1 hypothetical protein [Myroides pelagicus]
MKKVLMFLMASTFLLLGIGCSSDSNSTPEVLKQLELKASIDDIVVEESVTFSVTADGVAIKDVKIYANDVEIQKVYKFIKEGTYTVIAKAKGYENSKPITIKVNKKGSRKLILSADKDELKVGEQLTFKVMFNNEVIKDAVITSTNGGLVSDPTWTPTEAGTYSFTAKKDGFEASDVFVVTVFEKEKQKISLTVDKTEVKAGEKVTFSVKVNGEVLEGAMVKLLTGNPLDGLYWEPQEVGQYTFIAVKEGYLDSNMITVKVIENPLFVKEYIIVDGKKYTVDKDKTKLFAYTDASLSNQIKIYKSSYVNDNGVKVEFAYSLFYVALYSHDYEASNGKVVKGAEIRLSKMVLQDLELGEVILPGENSDLEINLGGDAYMKDKRVEIKSDWIQTYIVDLHGLNDEYGELSLAHNPAIQDFVLSYNSRVQSMFYKSDKEVSAFANNSFSEFSEYKNQIKAGLKQLELLKARKNRR